MRWIKIDPATWFSSFLRWELTEVERSILIDLALSSEYGEINYFNLNLYAKKFNIEKTTLDKIIKKFESRGIIIKKGEGFEIKIKNFFPKNSIKNQEQELPQLRGDIIITIPIINSKEEYPIYRDMLNEWQRLYPAIDVENELKKIRAWNLANPKYRKTSRGILRHINMWLCRAQDSKTPPKEKESFKGLKMWYKWSKDGNE